MKPKYLLVLFAFGALCGRTTAQSVAADCGSSPTVKFARTQRADFTPATTKELVELTATGACWNAPLTWRLTITSDGKELFSRTTTDERINGLFADPGFVNDTCKGYLACKKQYYLHDLPPGAIVHTTLGSNEHAFDPANPGSIQRVVMRQLTEDYKLSHADAARTVEALVQRVRSGIDVLYLPVSPVESETPRVYVPRVNAFLILYEW